MDAVSFADFGKGAFRCDIIAYGRGFKIVASPFSSTGHIRTEILSTLFAEIALGFFRNEAPFRLDKRLDKPFALCVEAATKGASFFFVLLMTRR